MKKIRVLVTGAGSGVGQSIVKALNISKLNLNIISADINELNAGLYRTKKSLLIPKIEKKNSLKLIIKILKKNKIDVLFVGSEIEIDFFSRHRDLIYKQAGTLVSTTNVNVVKIANDKFKSIEFFKNNNIKYPKSFTVSSKSNFNSIYSKVKKPFILKGRFGTSARSVYLIKDKKDFHNKISLVNKPMIQEYLGKKNRFFDEEFTCSVFTGKNKDLIGPFMAQRILKHGTSWITKTYRNNDLKKLMIKISRKINNEGTINVQFKKHKGNFIPFEINSRFSGTTCIRAAMGFNEPELYIKSFYLKKNIVNKKISEGIVFRYIEEIFLKTSKISKLKKNFSKGLIKKWF